MLPSRSFDQLATDAGGIDNLLDVTRDPAAYPTIGDIADRSILVTDLHEQYPPIWLTCDRVDDGTDLFTSTTGAESPEYLADAEHHEAWTCALYASRFPWTVGYLTHATPGTVARFTGSSGDYTTSTA